MRPARHEHVRASGELFQKIGQVARAIGSDNFYEQLLELFGSVFAHDYSCVLRYSRNAPPDILYARKFPKHLLDYYLEHAYYTTDPYFCTWRLHNQPGVLLLRDALQAAVDKDFYRLIYQRKAQYSDEMSLFLPTLGQSCIALFLERKTGHYSKREARTAQSVFPAIEGLHRAHVAHLFAGLRRGGTAESRVLLKFPTLIVDRAGARIHATPEWRKWEASKPTLRSIVQTLDAGGSSTLMLSDTAVVQLHRFDRSFQLAPGGRMYLIVEQLPGGEVEAARSRARVDFDRLNRRQRQLVILIVLGWTVGKIAQHLQISKGTIKNYRLTLYRKLGISSERTLISRFWPLVDEFRKDALVLRQSVAGKG